MEFMNKNNQHQDSVQKLLVTRPYIPSTEKYMRYVEAAFQNQWLTNNGPLVNELTQKLKDYLGVEYLLLVSNGTSALQIAYQLKNLANKSVITTPFTFPATSTALLWQNAKPVFADIDPNSWNLCPNSVEKKLQQDKAEAIVPVNIFGMPCDMEAFDLLAEKYQVPVIYDSAQALLSKYKGKSIFHYGHIHCVSFHATKLFHTVEGGALVFKDEADYEKAKKLINFGIDEHGQVSEVGINAKMSELHAAMGLCIFDDLGDIVENREESALLYKEALQDSVEFQKTDSNVYTPPMYMPIRLSSNQQLLSVQKALADKGIFSRKYFSPTKVDLAIQAQVTDLAVTQAIADNILCIPLMYGMSQNDINSIADIVKSHSR